MYETGAHRFHCACTVFFMYARNWYQEVLQCLHGIFKFVHMLDCVCLPTFTPISMFVSPHFEIASAAPAAYAIL